MCFLSRAKSSEISKTVIPNENITENRIRDNT